MALATTSNRFVILYTDINRLQLVLPICSEPGRMSQIETHIYGARKNVVQTTSSYQPYHPNNKRKKQEKVYKNSNKSIENQAYHVFCIHRSSFLMRFLLISIW